MKILAIETSCDDTGVAILEVLGTQKSPSFRVLSNVIASQIEVHKKYGGVFPAMAKREHEKNLAPTLKTALKEANIFGKDVDLIAVTNGPGLEPCLWVGVNFAKDLAKKWNTPLVPVNHIEGHILVNFLENKNIKFPAICLVMSGGHTQLILMKKIGDYKILGETRDDAAGECFDKCAKILGLSYPGGPEIAKLAAKAKEIVSPKALGDTISQQLQLPRPMMNTKDYDFSFSGLKTAVLYAVRGKKQAYMNFNDRSKSCTLNYNYKYKQGMAAEIQQAVIDVLLKKTIKAAKNYDAKSIILGGGVSANQELRRQFELKTNVPNASEPFSLVYPPANLSTDNAVMVAIAGYFHKNKRISCDIGSRTKLKADANLRIK